MRKYYLYIIITAAIILGIIQIAAYRQPYPEASYVNLSNGFIAYNEFNPEIDNDKTIIMIHGSPGSKDNFRLLAPEIKRYKVYALDMYCFGQSSYVKNCGIVAAADTIAEFMSSNNLSKTSILGYSWGGGAAIEFAYKYPEKTSYLILLDSMGIQEGEFIKNHYLEKTYSIISYPFVIYYPGAFAGDMKWRQGFIKSFMQTDLRPIRNRLNEIQTETLILHGNNDTVVPVWVAEEHTKLLKNSELVLFEGNHGTIFSNTTQISDEINKLLSQKNNAQAKINLFVE